VIDEVGGQRHCPRDQERSRGKGQGFVERTRR
jgi:hypothetical protein